LTDFSDDTLFGLSSDEKQLRQSFRSFFESELGENAFEIDKNDHFPQLREYIRNCGEMGILGLTVSEKYGGTDLGYFSIALAAEENARVRVKILT
jgi:isovaleryl-CoA dehydrogenase